MRPIVETRTEPVTRLTPAERGAMFALLVTYYDRVSREEFERDLAGKQHLIRMFGPGGELAGFSTIQLLETTHAGRRLTVVFSGDTVIDRPYWGQKQLQREFTRFLIRLRLRHPLRRLYWFLISKGYKTYLLMRNNLTSYPNYRAPTPPELQHVMDHVATLKYPQRYDPARGVITHEEGQTVKSEVACLEPGVEDDPEVRFFLERNPGWREGDELCCLARLGMGELLGAALKYALRRRPRRASPVAPSTS